MIAKQILLVSTLEYNIVENLHTDVWLKGLACFSVLTVLLVLLLFTAYCLGYPQLVILVIVFHKNRSQKTREISVLLRDFLMFFLTVLIEMK